MINYKILLSKHFNYSEKSSSDYFYEEEKIRELVEKKSTLHKCYLNDLNTDPLNYQLTQKL